MQSINFGCIALVKKKNWRIPFEGYFGKGPVFLRGTVAKYINKSSLLLLVFSFDPP